MSVRLHAPIGVFALCSAAILCSASAAQTICTEPICTKNTSRYVDKGRWDWTVFIDPQSAALDKIRCVEYTLHRTFPDPVRVVCGMGTRQQPFALSANGWGTFKVKVRVLLTDKSLIKLQHQLEFEPRPRPTPCPPVC